MLQPALAATHCSTILLPTCGAACTASERLAALGLHQNMWQQKEGWAGSHDECKCVDVSAHGQEGQEVHPGTPPALLSVCGEGHQVGKGMASPSSTGCVHLSEALPSFPVLPSTVGPPCPSPPRSLPAGARW